MRPRPDAAENADVRVAVRSLPKSASMRPRPDAAENVLYEIMVRYVRRLQ